MKKRSTIFPNMHKGRTFIQNSRFGYLFQSSQLSKKIISLSYGIQKEKGFMQISYLFRLLYLLSNSSKVEFLSMNFEQIINTQEKAKYESSIERTFRFIYAHFRNKLLSCRNCQICQSERICLMPVFQEGKRIYHYWILQLSADRKSM